MRSARGRRVAVGALWLAVIIAGQYLLRRSDRSVVEAAADAVETLRGAWWAGPAYVGIYAARSLTLFPAALLTVAAGVIFGPWLGVPLAIIGALVSAAISYEGARLVGPDERQLASPRLAPWVQRAQSAGFGTVLTLRLVMSPFDPVNLLAGALHVPRRDFLAATALGIVPGVMAFVLAGASVGRVDAGLGDLDPATLIAAGLTFGVSIAIAMAVRRHHDATNGPHPPGETAP
ncbi:MAG: VTT domain-containing protein [Microthrixaceae bacterium]